MARLAARHYHHEGVRSTDDHDERPTTSKSRPTAEKHRLTTNNQRPPTNDQVRRQRL